MADDGGDEAPGQAEQGPPVEAADEGGDHEDHLALPEVHAGIDDQGEGEAGALLDQPPEEELLARAGDGEDERDVRRPGLAPHGVEVAHLGRERRQDDDEELLPDPENDEQGDARRHAEGEIELPTRAREEVADHVGLDRDGVDGDGGAGHRGSRPEVPPARREHRPPPGRRDDDANDDGHADRRCDQSEKWGSGSHGNRLVMGGCEYW
jgi:hypothetical protein